MNFLLLHLYCGPDPAVCGHLYSPKFNTVQVRRFCFAYMLLKIDRLLGSSENKIEISNSYQIYFFILEALRAAVVSFVSSLLAE